MLLTFGSSFGQTYFISIYSGVFREEFGLSHADWGSIYGIGTLASAVAVLALGGLADRYGSRAFGTAVIALFAVVCATASQISAAWALPLMIFGLRFCGQGMMSHIAMVSVGRWFAAARGKAVSITALGYGIGESVFPISFVALMGWIGWRGSWGVAACVLLVLMVVFRGLLRGERTPQGHSDTSGTPGMRGRHWTRRDALGHWLFWVTLPGFLAFPVFGTAFFFQQVHLTDVKGWTLASFVSLIPLYTVASISSLFLGGWAVDRFGSGSVLQVFLLPLAAGFCVVAVAEDLWVAAIGVALIGTVQGLSTSVVGAFWPEHYGTQHLGAIRSISGAVMVFATALGPAITGYLIDAGVDYQLQLLVMAGYAVAMSALFAVSMAVLRRASNVPA